MRHDVKKCKSCGDVIDEANVSFLDDDLCNSCAEEGSDEEDDSDY